MAVTIRLSFSIHSYFTSLPRQKTQLIQKSLCIYILLLLLLLLWMINFLGKSNSNSNSKSKNHELKGEFWLPPFPLSPWLGFLLSLFLVWGWGRESNLFIEWDPSSLSLSLSLSLSKKYALPLCAHPSLPPMHSPNGGGWVKAKLMDRAWVTKKSKKITALRVPRLSPTLVLTEPEEA